MPERSWKLAQRGSERNRLPLSPVPFIPLASHFSTRCFLLFLFKCILYFMIFPLIRVRLSHPQYTMGSKARSCCVCSRYFTESSKSCVRKEEEHVQSIHQLRQWAAADVISPTVIEIEF